MARLLVCRSAWGEDVVQHVFGGAHTDEKLERLKAYLTAFSIALKDQGFVRVYIDAFAGSGGRAEVL